MLVHLLIFFFVTGDNPWVLELHIFSIHTYLKMDFFNKLKNQIYILISTEHIIIDQVMTYIFYAGVIDVTHTQKNL